MAIDASRIRILAILILATPGLLSGCGGGSEDGAISASKKYGVGGEAEAGKSTAASQDALKDMGTSGFASSKKQKSGRSPSEGVGGPTPDLGAAAGGGSPTSKSSAGSPAAGDDRSGSVAGVPKPPTTPPTAPPPAMDDLQIPNGTPAELLAFVESLLRRGPQGATEAERLADVQKIYGVSIQVCEKILAQEAPAAVHRRAAELKLGSLDMLVRMGVPQAAGHIRKFCAELRKHPDAVLARLGLILDFGLNAEDFANQRLTDFNVLQKDLDTILSAEDVTDRDLGAVEQAALQLFESEKRDESEKIIQQVVAKFADAKDPAIRQRVAGLPEKILIMSSDIPVRIEHFSQTGEGADKMLASVQVLLAAEARGRNILGLAVQVADTLERQGRFEMTKTLYEAISAAYKDDPDPDVVKFSKRAAATSATRISLLGKPLVLSGELVSGDPVPWEQYRGKVTLLFFWSTQNLLSMQEMSIIGEAYRRFESRGFAALGVNVDGDPAGVRDFTNFQKAPWENMCISADKEDDPIAVQTGLGPVPYNILLDRKGVVRKIHVSGPDLLKRIEEMLDAPSEDGAAGTEEPAKQESLDQSSIWPDSDLVFVATAWRSQEPQEADPQADEKPALANPYLAPAGLSTSQLIDFLFAMEDKPKTIRRRPGFGAAVSEAADRVLADPQAAPGQQRVAYESKFLALHYAANWDDALAEQLLQESLAKLPAELPASVKKLTDFLKLEQRALAADDLPVEQIPALLQEVVAFFEAQGGDTGEQHLRLASAAVHAANRIKDDDAREQEFAKLGKALAVSDNGEVARYGSKLSKPAGASPSALVGKPLELEGTTALGDAFRWSDYRGKVVLVDFWATWCGPCLREMPHVRELYDELKDKGFDIVAVSLDRDLDAVRDFLEEKKTPWTNLIGEETQRLAERYGVRAIPTMMLIDAEGNVVAVSHKVSELAPQAKKMLGRE